MGSTTHHFLRSFHGRFNTKHPFSLFGVSSFYKNLHPPLERCGGMKWFSGAVGNNTLLDCHEYRYDKYPQPFSPHTELRKKIYEKRFGQKKLKKGQTDERWIRGWLEYKSLPKIGQIKFKLTQARRREHFFMKVMEDLVPEKPLNTIHDPEVLTPEEKMYYCNKARKKRNYVPVGISGISSGLILNTHLHWKKHETVKFLFQKIPHDQIEKMAIELVQLTGGIVLEIYCKTVLTMFRGKNYTTPPTEFMSPKCVLTKEEAFKKAYVVKILNALKIRIRNLERELQAFRGRLRGPEIDYENEYRMIDAEYEDLKKKAKLRVLALGVPSHEINESESRQVFESTSCDFKDIHRNNQESQETSGPSQITENMEERDKPDEKLNVLELDEIDRMFLPADPLLKK